MMGDKNTYLKTVHVSRTKQYFFCIACTIVIQLVRHNLQCMMFSKWMCCCSVSMFYPATHTTNYWKSCWFVSFHSLTSVSCFVVLLSGSTVFAWKCPANKKPARLPPCTCWETVCGEQVEKTPLMAHTTFRYHKCNPLLWAHDQIHTKLHSNESNGMQFPVPNTWGPHLWK